MIKLAELKNAHKGRPALVLGGAVSLESDVDLAREYLGQAKPVLFAVNHHAFYVGIEPDYMLFMDDPINHPNLFQAAKDSAAIKLCPLLQYTDVHMAGVQYWNGPSSALPVVWLACFTGCDPVLLCGFDCYQNEVKYCHPGEPDDKPVFQRPLEDHLQRWKRGFQPDVCPGIERVRVMSGPLVDVFPSYNEPVENLREAAEVGCKPA